MKLHYVKAIKNCRVYHMNTNNNRHLLSTYHVPEAVVAHMIINTIMITVIPQLRQPTLRQQQSLAQDHQLGRPVT